MAILKNAIQALDPAPDKKKDLTLLLSLLSETCAQKVNEFTLKIENELRIAGTGENKTVPVTEILARYSEYRAYVKSDAGKIAGEVSGAIKKFVSGGANNIIDGITSLVTTGVEAIIGAGNATEQQVESYYIVVQDYGIARYDIRVWTRQIEAAGITSQIETALASVAFKSSVDVTKLTFNTFLIAYGSQLQTMGFNDKEQKEYLDYAIEIYNKLKGNSAITSSISMPDGQTLLNGYNSLSFSTAPTKLRVPGKLYGSLWEE